MRSDCAKKQRHWCDFEPCDTLTFMNSLAPDAGDSLAPDTDTPVVDVAVSRYDELVQWLHSDVKPSDRLLSVAARQRARLKNRGLIG